MEHFEESFKEVLASRLIAGAEKQVNRGQKEKALKKNTQVQPRDSSSVPSQDFVKIEKNLASLGFFTPSSRRLKGTQQKVIEFAKVIDGKKVEVRAVILPSAKYGLPITSDQDKYLALSKIVLDRREYEKIENPIKFSSYELLRVLGKNDGGKNYSDVAEWLKRMSSTTISSEGVVYLAQGKKWASDIFHVWDRAISVGKQLPDGTIADQNFIWLSDWQLENLKANHVLPVDLATYQKLKNHIAKSLVLLLQIWLFASQRERIFTKRYEELCQILHIRQFYRVSEIVRQLKRSLDELVFYSYLGGWRIERTSDRKHFKVIFQHGEKFYRDRQARLTQKEQAPKAVGEEHTTGALLKEVGQGIDVALLREMTKRGITEKRARKLLNAIPEGQQVLDQLEWGDFLIQQGEPGRFYNAPGFFIHLIKEDILPAETFVSTRKRKLLEDAQRARERHQQEEARLQLAYEDYQKRTIDTYIREHYSQEEYQRRLEAKKQELLRQNYKLFSFWKPEALADFADRKVRTELAQGATLVSFTAFCQKQRQGELS